jgi:glyoxylase-like metal-dependent hydrolase (beta-lactamase superfamily II)
MTLNGTNTWLLGDPAAGPVVVVDPGPDDDGHRQAILAAAGAGVAVVVLTHRHADHSAGAAALAVAAGCSVRAVDPALRIPAGAALADGDALVLPGGTLRVLATPGHTADSCCLLLTGDDGVARLLTGDTVLGRGTTVIAEPDGHLGDTWTRFAGCRRSSPGRRSSSCCPGTARGSRTRSTGSRPTSGTAWSGWSRSGPRSRPGR